MRRLAESQMLVNANPVTISQVQFLPFRQPCGCVRCDVRRYKLESLDHKLMMQQRIYLKCVTLSIKLCKLFVCVSGRLYVWLQSPGWTRSDWQLVLTGVRSVGRDGGSCPPTDLLPGDWSPGPELLRPASHHPAAPGPGGDQGRGGLPLLLHLQPLHLPPHLPGHLVQGGGQAHPRPDPAWRAAGVEPGDGQGQREVLLQGLHQCGHRSEQGGSRHCQAESAEARDHPPPATDPSTERGEDCVGLPGLGLPATFLLLV